jgi:hypothetical protein
MSGDAARHDAALRVAFAELAHGEAAGAPAFSELMARPRTGSARGADEPGRRWRGFDARRRERASAPKAALRGLAPRLAAAAAVVVAVATGVWLGRTAVEPGAALAQRDAESLASWVAPTDFLLDTSVSALLRTTPDIPGPLPLAPAGPATTTAHLRTGETR